MSEKLLCCCHNVTEDDMKKHIENGVVDFTELQKLTGIGTGCPPCEKSNKEVFRKFLENRN